jgi:hypothetical protein
LEEELDKDSIFDFMMILLELYSKYVTMKAAEGFGESKKEEK